MGWSSILLFLIAITAQAAEISTVQFSRDLDASSKACLRNFAPGGTGTQEAFETCLSQALNRYYTAVVEKAWGAPKTKLLAGDASPTPTPTPEIDRPKEEAKVRDEFKKLVKSARCQRCHVGLDASQFTLAQMHAVLNTPSHRERLGPKELDLLRNLGTLLK
jgi:hypothetical protein